MAEDPKPTAAEDQSFEDMLNALDEPEPEATPAPEAAPAPEATPAPKRRTKPSAAVETDEFALLPEATRKEIEAGRAALAAYANR